MKHHKMPIGLVAVTLLMLSLVASEAFAATPTPSATPVTVIDALGREVTLANLPARIVAAGKAAWMTVHALYMFPDAHERFLAMGKRGQQTSEFLTALYPDFPAKPHLETETGPEQIAPLKPDTVILKSYMKSRLGDPLERLGLPVIYVDLETPEQYFRDITTLGQIMGHSDRAAEIIAFYQTRLNKVQARLSAGGTMGDKPRVLVIQYNERGGELAFDVPPPTWMQTIQVELAGGEPVWKDAASGQGWQVVTFEQVAAWDPDYIFVIVFRSDPQPIMERMQADVKWQGLRATQQGKLLAFPADFFGWDVPDPRWMLGLLWAAKTLHPDRFADLDMSAELYSFYEQLYGLTPAEIAEKIIPNVKGDALNPSQHEANFEG